MTLFDLLVRGEATLNYSRAGDCSKDTGKPDETCGAFLDELCRYASRIVDKTNRTGEMMGMDEVESLF